MSKILVTGGAGYIGSHTTLALNEAGYEVVVYDNLSTGKAEAVLPPARLVVGDLAQTEALDRLMAKEKFSAVLHFAGSIVVPESVENPLKYYMNNTGNTTELIRLAVKNAIPRFIFSSTAAVYGMPDTAAVTEDSPTKPINPYGRTKLMSEWVIEDTAAAHPDFSFVILRYFNVAGADPKGRIGQSTPDATHLIKVASQAALGRRDALHIFGTDYDTPDGTCIRDYIHVTDLAAAHVLALGHLEAGNPAGIFNCGYGHGYSVRDIVSAVKEASKVDFPVIESPRRAGDPPALISDPTRIRATMNWKPAYDDIQAIALSAYRWEMKL
ncbi:UDP-glucose 4-epimerase GalE [Desulfomicrobium sp. ZS1]|uniref:UDP-glucose 4-epimerase GalE n=1 Tax=Desulfomicrobium sp. ZS1 TaxID=2952228 RepID=UPI0020B217ED|nr:UDP-glucose 4-epimerase GalE [Desulfomicrobium sp. ZS1]UTF49004.1 UDP-glucose 4-epimerase GalE [Desulfomicrobium sp. ZS1]